MLSKQAISRILSDPDLRRERQSSLWDLHCCRTLATYPSCEGPIRYCTDKYEFSRFTLALRRALSITGYFSHFWSKRFCSHLEDYSRWELPTTCWTAWTHETSSNSHVFGLSSRTFPSGRLPTYL